MEAAAIAACLLSLQQPWRTRFLTFCAGHLRAPWHDGEGPGDASEVARWLAREERAARYLEELLWTWGALGERSGQEVRVVET